MDNGITKKGIFNLTVEPYLKPISDIGVGFYNLDENTATLRFNLYNTKGPLLIGENNVDVHAYFESSNGSVSGEIEVNIVDELNGIVGITLDKEFLQASTSTTVKGQLYVGVKNVDNKPEYNEVAVLREFDFEVADALINKISSFTKIEYIRMFDKLKEQIQQRVHDIEEAIANGEDYVAEMKNTLANGKAELNNIVTDGINNINNLVNQYKQDVLDLKNTAETNIEKVSTDSIKQMKDETATILDNVSEGATDVINHINNKMTEFNEAVETNGFLTPTELDTKVNSLLWQRKELTKSSGYTLYDENVHSRFDFNDNVKMNALNTGFYYVTNAQSKPANATNGNGYLTVIRRDSNYARIEFRPYDSEQIFVKIQRIEWQPWIEATSKRTNTGWLPLTLKNGATQIDGNYPQSTYRVIDFGTHKEIDLRLSVSNITENSVIAFIPQIFTGNEFHNFQGITNNQSAIPRIAINKIGDITFSTNPTGVWSTSDILVVETSWRI
ncbi:BppU family phage baseplate upper protein [Mammaliicoccus sciuri]|uniref:BppU family phage baseplate upper protein n=1 Tax=Mammaliicoccus sciuri TaxID=1296 RepID=UPI000E6A06B9|nr:BppU family phage baseplate upper protein [Mammaliicoccus sciuri]RIN99079.1 DUF2479 domain-containing protein [Mammaliicoccus sciuri]